MNDSVELPNKTNSESQEVDIDKEKKYPTSAFFKCPIEDCSYMGNESDLKNGNAVKHMLDQHKIPPCKMIRMNLRWRQVASSAHFEYNQAESQTLVRDSEEVRKDGGNESEASFQFVTAEKIELFKRKVMENREKLYKRDNVN